MPKSAPKSPSALPRDDLPVDCVVQPCPLGCKPITAITVVSLSCQSDHQLLKNNAADWRDTGSRYPKPEWTAAHGGAVGAPVTHTLDQSIAFEVVVDVQPANACVEPGTFEGTGPDGVRFEPMQVTFKPGRNTFHVRSASRLPRAVRKLSFDADWTAAAASGSFSSKTRSYVLLTMNTPITGGAPEDGVTLKRMVKAIDLVGAVSSLDPHTIVTGLMKPLKYFTLERNASVPTVYNHPTFFNESGGAWALGGEYPSAYGECQAIVRFVHGVINQVGCPGTANAVVIWADPDVNGGATPIESPYGSRTLHGRTRMVGGKAQHVALAATDQPLAVGRLYRPGSMMNMYEACLKFSHGTVTKYYGGGAGIYDGPDGVIKAFVALVWYSYEVQPNGNVMNRVQEIVHTYGP